MKVKRSVKKPSRSEEVGSTGVFWFVKLKLSI